MDFILFLLATVGLTNIIVHGKIFESVIPIKPWLKKKLSKDTYELFECCECMGFWCGLVCGLIIFPSWIFLIYGFIGSLISGWNNLIFEYVNSKIEFVISTLDEAENESGATDQS